ncbi:MAG: hypothetical protein AAFP70_14765, partial [Calditrichota bacterium]
MNFRIRTAILVFCLSLFTTQAQETLPPYHWANTAIDYLKVSGHLPGLSMNERPFNRQELAKHLLKINSANLATKDRGIVKNLYRELASELQLLGRSEDSDWAGLLKTALENLQLTFLPETVAPRIKAGFFTEPAFDYNNEIDSEVDFDLHSQAAVIWGDRFFAYNNMRVFNNPPATYIGKSFGEFFAYNEQSYMQYNHGWFSAKFGRDF